jgi:hypothetical protein
VTWSGYCNWSRFLQAIELQATASTEKEEKDDHHDVQLITADPAVVKEDSDEEPQAEVETQNSDLDPAVPAKEVVELQELLLYDLSPQFVISSKHLKSYVFLYSLVQTRENCFGSSLKICQ